ncbi:MAG: hypothetical protein HY898_32780 [Deltaproteobacteria bacterium]|nr:hypothetical protein [Deltaproteobacteria bacterium]
MRLGTHLAIALLALAPVAVSCGQLATADALGSESVVPGSQQFAPGTIGNQCIPQDDGCQWLSNECAADPDCAKWYQCILSCKADNTVDACFATCNGTGKVSAERQKLQKCLLTSSNCLGSNPVPGGAGGTEKGGTGGSDYSGGAGGGALNGDASATADPDANAWSATESQYENCHQCAYTECISPLCQASSQPDVCYQFKAEFVATCMDKNPPTEAALEICLWEEQLKNATEPTDPHPVWIAAGVTKCVDETCPHLCTPPDYQACIACQRTNCKDQWDEYLASADAQDYQWCRTKCDFGAEGKPVPDASACKKACADDFPEGQAIVGQLLGCKVDKCNGANVCAGLP